MTLSAYYRSCKFAKGARVVEQLEKDRAEDAKERRCRSKVNKRDGRRCFFPGCKTPASDKHHILARSLGGKWQTRNILSACRKHHDYFKAGLIVTKGNPDRGPVRVLLTALGKAAKLRLPKGAEK